MTFKVRLSGIDWREAQTFLASNMSELEIKSEGLKDLVPARLWKRGARPSKTTTELGARKLDPTKDPPVDQRPTKWASTDPDRLSEHQKRRLISKVVGVAVLTVFRHHMYQFNGEVFSQDGGAPIGLRLTSICARIVMDHWASIFLTRVSEAGTDVHLFAKYVDDVNLVLSGLALGTRWSKDTMTLTHLDSLEREDRESGRSTENVTMECMRSAAD